VVRPPYPAAVRLCGIAADRWEQIDAAYYQINLLRIPAYRFVGLVYAWAIERVPHDKLDEWKADLNELLPWQDGESEAAVEMESESFYAAMAAQGG
jgi:uncharacterized linocin/CFP29 family protein